MKYNKFYANNAIEPLKTKSAKVNRSNKWNWLITCIAEDEFLIEKDGTVLIGIAAYSNW